MQLKHSKCRQANTLDSLVPRLVCSLSSWLCVVVQTMVGFPVAVIP